MLLSDYLNSAFYNAWKGKLGLWNQNQMFVLLLSECNCFYWVRQTCLCLFLSSRSILCNLSSLSTRRRSRSAARDSWCCRYEEDRRPPRAGLKAVDTQGWKTDLDNSPTLEFEHGAAEAAGIALLNNCGGNGTPSPSYSSNVRHHMWAVELNKMQWVFYFDGERRETQWQKHWKGECCTKW